MSTLVLALEAHQRGSSVLYRLQQGTHLHFRLGASLLGCHIDLFTNHQANYRRDDYVRLEWRQEGDATAAVAAVEIVRSGSFHFYFKSEKEEVGGDGYFVVDPVLCFKPELPPLPLDCVQCQTVVAKNLGDFKTWDSKLKLTQKSGYNMIHFTPVQALGASNSAYSLRSQLDLNPVFETDWTRLMSFIEKMRSECQLLSICDVVLNHTANETEWLPKHPEATYNAWNSPHLRPAIVLDRVVYRLSADIEDGKWVDRGLKKGQLDSEQQLQTVKALLYDHYYPQVNFFEFFLADVADILSSFEKRLLTQDNEALYTPQADAKLLKLQPDSQYRRLKAQVDLDIALKVFNLHHPECTTEEQRILKCCSELKRHLDQLNHEAYNQTWAHLHAATDNILAGARYHRLDPSGPKITKCGRDEPVSFYYFLAPKESEKTSCIKKVEKLIYDPDLGKRFMAHNGWVMNWDSRVNFALAPSNVYLRRELVVWGDSVKLRYGDKPDDVPFLWSLMREYVEKTAKVFDGIRLDNCHSTPIHVAEYLLDAARLVKSNLYVIAELFTTTEHTDNLFINRLGINSLIREALTAWDSHEQGRLVHRFGGLPVGSFKQMQTRPLVPSIAHAIFFDQTHDNPSFSEKRSVFDQIPTAAMVNMTACATGSTRGYDELVPHMIHVVHEPRTYASWGKEITDGSQGIIGVKEALNRLHNYLGSNGFGELYVDQMDGDVVAVTRHNPETHETVVCVAHTVFNKHTDVKHTRHVKPVRVQGDLVKIILEAKLEQVDTKEFKKNDNFINGDMDNFKSYFKENFDIKESKMCHISDVDKDNYTTIQLHNFAPGSTIVFHFKLPSERAANTDALNELIRALNNNECSDLKKSIAKVDLLDMNFVLFRCNEEEEEDGKGGCYTLDSYGRLKYAGLQGFMSILNDIRALNDLGNWLPTNLRNGDWAMDYIVNRLRRRESTSPLADWLDKNAFAKIKAVPRFLVPRYFDAVVTRVFQLLLDHTWSKMSKFVQNGSSFAKALALGSVQHVAVSGSAQLPKLSPNLVKPISKLPTIAAGLPHFSIGYMRSWGRDTFIALRGMLLITGRYEDARAIILGYAATLRHGLIPNLLDGGRNARYNCRDATWWWLYALLDYVQEVKGGEAILKDRVSRLYPKDDDEMKGNGEVEQSLEEVIYEALQRHFQGLKFRERNAGSRIDEHMKDEGFNNSIGVDLETGFVFGGNIYNCGTWMDKMGSSAKAGNKGNPTTPRDGSAVEIVGLSYACLKKLAALNEAGKFSFKSVKRSSPDMEWSFRDWSDRIKSNFESHFHINTKNDPGKTEKRPDLINVEHIYKDTLNSGNAWCDYQLRCNFPIAMAVAPEIFDKDKAWEALQIVKKRLMGKLGIATLDPKDWAYRGCYDNGNDSHDPTVAHGANYHQGPEWVWPVGFFLKAYIVFAKQQNKEAEATDYVMATLSNHFEEVQKSHWKGIPELTNANGNFCPGSNPIQAWSMSCLLEVLYDM